MEKVAYIDNDGVLVEYRKGMIKRIAIALGKPIDESFLEHFYETTKMMDDNEIINAFSRDNANLQQLLNVGGIESFASDVKVYKQAREGLELLKQHNFRVYVVTARTERMREATIQTFVQNELTGFIDDVFMRYSKDVPSVVFKGEIASRLGTTHAFEDTFANLESVRNHCLALKKAYLIDQPWNEKYDVEELYPVANVQIERMESFHHAVLDAISTLKK